MNYYMSLIKKIFIAIILCSIISSGITAEPIIRVGDYAVTDLVQVAEVDVEVPPLAEDIILKATMPIPIGEYPQPGTLYVVLDHSNKFVIAQTEVVTRSPDGQSAEIVEIISPISFDPDNNPNDVPGEITTYQIFRANIEQSIAVPTPQKFLDSIPQEIVNEIYDNSLKFRTWDAFGNEYEFLPFDFENLVLKRYGFIQSEVEIYGHFSPVPGKSDPQTVMPYFLGIRVFVSMVKELGIVSLDWEIDNGPFGEDPKNDPHHFDHTRYFREIELECPLGWIYAVNFEDPTLGAAQDIAAENVTRIPVVMPNDDGTMHCILSRGLFHRRSAVAPAEFLNQAESWVKEFGHGQVKDGYTSDGNRFYSWFNPETAFYYPQKDPLPHFDHIGKQAIKSKFSNDLADYEGYLSEGADSNSDAVTTGNLGPFHPSWIKNANGTGGHGIITSEGVRQAYAGYREGYRLFQAFHRMCTSRNPIALYGANGQTPVLEDMLFENPNGTKYTEYSFSQTSIGPEGFFGKQVVGIDEEPDFHELEVESQGLAPEYEGLLKEYKKFDIQHFIRNTKNIKTLVYLGNDSLAKSQLKSLANLTRFYLTPYFTTHNHGVDSNSMRAALNHVGSNPGLGTDTMTARAGAWVNDTCAAFYQVADDEWRSITKPWFDQWVDIVERAQICTGGTYSKLNEGKIFVGLYGTQSWEDRLGNHARWATFRCVYDGLDDPVGDQLIEIVKKSCYFNVTDIFWTQHGDKQGTHSRVATHWPDLSLAPFCNPEDLPEDMETTGEFNTNYLPHELVRGFVITGDMFFLEKLVAMYGTGGSLKNELYKNNSFDKSKSYVKYFCDEFGYSNLPAPAPWNGSGSSN